MEDSLSYRSVLLINIPVDLIETNIRERWIKHERCYKEKLPLINLFYVNVYHNVSNIYKQMAIK